MKSIAFFTFTIEKYIMSLVEKAINIKIEKHGFKLYSFNSDELIYEDMNRIILIASLLLIAIVVAVLLLRDNSTIEQNYHIEDTKTITKVVIDDKDGNHLELLKKEDSVWSVNGSPANQKVIDMLLTTLKDMRI